MRQFFKISASAFLCVLMGCNSTKQVTSKENESSIKETTKELVDKGYVKAEFVDNSQSKAKTCATMIKLVNNKQSEMLDPINMDDKYSELKNSKIWIKYTSLRMKNRCDEARPVNIVDIKKREE
ncbi:hypothetical protein SAMN04489761_2176 [Tenacibaculum sp. MAR_2009_124]|uniref:hypothetical protein n=1 Tax=Tenacibaculum sp. MAR_2009_124 TaxID=1250059 RepID=UPI0008959B8E|nr:hypothetical protein [Tenacibaculum sp. MAR_2009_124]SEB98817.1 hypothetical protein SAMN04489761_2176 [Tenacibaculum sp. MAR_2009_124]